MDRVRIFEDSDLPQSVSLMAPILRNILENYDLQKFEKLSRDELNSLFYLLTRSVYSWFFKNSEPFLEILGKDYSCSILINESLNLLRNKKSTDLRLVQDSAEVILSKIQKDLYAAKNFSLKYPAFPEDAVLLLLFSAETDPEPFNSKTNPLLRSLLENCEKLPQIRKQLFLRLFRNFGWHLISETTNWDLSLTYRDPLIPLIFETMNFLSQNVPLEAIPRLLSEDSELRFYSSDVLKLFPEIMGKLEEGIPETEYPHLDGSDTVRSLWNRWHRAWSKTKDKTLILNPLVRMILIVKGIENHLDLSVSSLATIYDVH